MNLHLHLPPKRVARTFCTVSLWDRDRLCRSLRAIPAILWIVFPITALAGDLSAVGEAAAFPGSAASLASSPHFISVRSDIATGEEFDAPPDAPAQLLFSDGSTLIVGATSHVTIDRFSYDASSHEAKLAISLSNGVIRIIGGRASKAGDGIEITTPSATIYLQGGIADIDHDASIHTTQAAFLFGQKMEVISASDQQSVSAPGFSITADRNGAISRPALLDGSHMDQVNSRLDGTRNVAESPSISSPLHIDGTTESDFEHRSQQPWQHSDLLSGSEGATATIDQLKATIAQQLREISGRNLSPLTPIGSQIALESGAYNVASVLPVWPILYQPNPFSPLPISFPTTNGIYSVDNTLETGSFSELTNLTFNNSQIRELEYSSYGKITSAFGSTAFSQTSNVDVSYKFTDSKLINVISDNSVIIGAVKAGIININYHDSILELGHTFNSNDSISYSLDPATFSPIAFGPRIDLTSLMPSNTLWTYDLSTATPVYFNGSHITGTLDSAKLTVFFNGSPVTNASNIAADFRAQITIAGQILSLSTDTTPTRSSLAAGLLSVSQNGVSGGALIGNSLENSLSGSFTVATLNGGNFCNYRCFGSLHGFFAGKTAGQFAFVYQVQNITTSIIPALNINGAAALTHH